MIKRLIIAGAAICAFAAVASGQFIGGGISSTQSVVSFGAKCDGVTDDSAAINAAVANAGSFGKVLFPNSVCAVASTIVLGNGTTTTISTINSVTLEGVGKPFPRLGLYMSLGLVGTQFKWIGPAGGIMVKIVGPVTGIDLHNIALDANNLALTCLQIISGGRGYFPNLTCANYTGYGLDITTQAAAILSGGQDNSQLSSVDLTFANYAGYTFNHGSTGISLDGYLGDGNNDGFDTTRVHFYNTVLGVPSSGSSVGIRIAFADQNIFNGLVVAPIGSSDGTSFAIKYVPSATNPSRWRFPQNNEFTGHTDFGHGLGLDVGGDSAVLGGGNTADNITGLDFPLVPHDPVSRWLRFNMVELGDFPAGGYWVQGGQNVLERQFRNQFVNSTFLRASRGTSFSSPASNTYLLDNWVIRYDGSMSAFTPARNAFKPGQPSIPYNPEYFFSIPFGQQTGGTFYYFGQRIPGLARYSGRRTTLSAWIQGYGCTPVLSARAIQFFGTGGSPSSPAITTPILPYPLIQLSPGVWKRYYFELDIPSISGKTLGTNGDDYLEIDFALPPNYITCSINIALPQFEFGIVDTAFELRPDYIDEVLASRTLRTMGLGSTGVWADSSTAILSAIWPLSMWRAPKTAVVLPGKIAVLTVAERMYEARSPKVTIVASSPNGLVLSVSGFSGAPAQSPLIATSDIAIVSAEP